MSSTPTPLSVLDERELLAQVSDRDGLERHFATGCRVAYVGFDPTAPSLQVGNLAPLLALRRLQLLGHRPIALVGGATGLIGDPGGRAEERSLNDPATVAGWGENIRVQLGRLLDTDGAGGALLLDNLAWTAELKVVDFLRELGKHFSINAMVQRDSVRLRLARQGQGISYAEFSYMLLQANDFLELARRHDCTVQIGGSDQWGNIVSGVDLVRRVLERQAFALTMPLVTKQDGGKFGKSAEGAVWLDPTLTSPYAFHQFWLNAADADVVQYLRCFTLLELAAIDAAAEAVRTRPEARSAQHLLADETTRLVHGDDAVQAAERIARALFDGDVRKLGEEDLGQLARDGVATSEVAPGTGLLAAMAGSGLAASNGAARRLVDSGAVRVNGEKVADSALRLEPAGALFGRFHMVRRGRKEWRLLLHPAP